jgi:hypothetical protein
MSIVYVEDIKAALADFYIPEEAEQWLGIAMIGVSAVIVVGASFGDV